MPNFFIYCSIFLPLFCVVLITHNCCADLMESPKINCSQMDCIKSCPADSWPKSTLINYDEEESLYDDIDLNDYDYNEYGPLRLDFEDDDDVKSTHIRENSSTPLKTLNNDYDLDTKSRKRRHVKTEVNVTQCCEHYECICKKCNAILQCPEGEVAVLIQEGYNIPGSCCSMYECKKRSNCTDLASNNQTYWRTNCIECRCIGKIEICKNYCPEKESLQNCYSDYWKKPIINGAHWNEGPCMSCTCKQGEKKCITSICPKLPCQEYITKKNACCPVCKQDHIDQHNDKPHEISTEAAPNKSNITKFGLITSKEELAPSIKPIIKEENSVTTNFNLSTERQENIKISTQTSSSILESTTKNLITSHKPTTLESSKWNEISVNTPNILTKQTKFNKTLSIINDISQLPLISTSTSIPSIIFKDNVDSFKTSTIKSTIQDNTIQLITVTDMPTQTKSIVANITESPIYNTSTFTVTNLTNILHFNKTFIFKENKEHSLLLNDLIFIIIIGALSLFVLSIILALTILFIKKRKKMYSCIPNSEGSLSQTSTTTTVLT